MRLSKAQQSALAQRIVDQFESFLSSELSYQVENMKDNDELDWGYDLSNEDADDITNLVVDMIAVPVS